MTTPPARPPTDRPSRPVGPVGSPQQQRTGSPEKQPNRIPPARTWVLFFLVLLVNILLSRYFFPSGPATVKIPYTLFRDEVARRNVAAIYSRGTSITGRF